MMASYKSARALEMAVKEAAKASSLFDPALQMAVDGKRWDCLSNEWLEE